VLKLNDDELPALSRTLSLPGSTEHQGRASDRAPAQAYSLQIVGADAWCEGQPALIRRAVVRLSISSVKSSTPWAQAIPLPPAWFWMLRKMTWTKSILSQRKWHGYVCPPARAGRHLASGICEKLFPSHPRVTDTQRRHSHDPADHSEYRLPSLKHWPSPVADSLAVGILWLIGLWIIRVPWAPLWAVLARGQMFSPCPDSWIAWPMLASLRCAARLAASALLLILYAVIVVIDGLVLQPYIMRRVARVPMWASDSCPWTPDLVIPFWILLAPAAASGVYAYKARRAETRGNRAAVTIILDSAAPLFDRLESTSYEPVLEEIMAALIDA